MDEGQVEQSAREYVELEADTAVEAVEIVEGFDHFGDECYVLTVETTDEEIPEWWVVAGQTPSNRYPKSQFDDPDYVFSFHQGVMSRVAERQLKEMDEPPEGEKYDVFICHASEDKDNFVRPLARELNRQGHIVWYDEDEIEIGESITESIDEGLSRSHCGAVVLSESFFGKGWTQRELNGLTTREVETDAPVILPVWYDIEKEDIMEHSPSLADKRAVKANGEEIQQTARRLSSAISASIRERSEN